MCTGNLRQSKLYYNLLNPMELSLKNTMKTEKKVKANDLVEVVGTGNSKFLKEGVKKTVHRVAADKLQAQGFAVLGGDPLPPKSGRNKKNDKLEM